LSGCSTAASGCPAATSASKYGPLPDGITDLAEADAAPLCENVLGLHIIRDGCAAQYQGRGNYHNKQTSRAGNKVHHGEVRNPEEHGK